jgi:excisionase family DNA binding protein
MDISKNSLLTEKELASYLKCSVALIRKWRTKKEGPKVTRLGDLVRYHPADLEAWMRQEVAA